MAPLNHKTRMILQTESRALTHVIFLKFRLRLLRPLADQWTRHLLSHMRLARGRLSSRIILLLLCSPTPTWILQPLINLQMQHTNPSPLESLLLVLLLHGEAKKVCRADGVVTMTGTASKGV